MARNPQQSLTTYPAGCQCQALSGRLGIMRPGRSVDADIVNSCLMSKAFLCVCGGWGLQNWVETAQLCTAEDNHIVKTSRILNWSNNVRLSIFTEQSLRVN